MLATKENKEEAFYTIIPVENKRCDLCKFFQKVPGTLDMSGTCSRVNGIIHPDASCDNFQSLELKSKSKN